MYHKKFLSDPLIAVLHLIIFFFPVNSVHGQSGSWKSRHFTLEEGLPSNNILSINQDSLDYIWVGTDNGLCRYNGINFRNYFYIQSDTNSISGNSIKKLLVDSKKRLLIGTAGGLCVYNVDKDNFTRIYNKINVYDIAEDNRGHFWVASEGNGLLHFSPDFKLISQINSHSIQGSVTDYPNSVFADSQIIWIGSLDGKLIQLNIAAEKPTLVTGIGKALGPVSYINKDKSGNIIINTDALGFCKLIEKTGKFSVTPLHSRDRFTLNGMVNAQDKFWIMHSQGIISDDTEKLGSYNLPPLDWFRQLSLDNGLHCLFIDKHMNIWMGGHNKGLCLISNLYKKFHHYSSKIPNSSFILDLMQDSYNNYHAVSATGQIFFKGPNSKEFTQVDNSLIFKEPEISPNTIFKVLEVSPGIFLYATYKGLILYNKPKNQKEYYYLNNGKKSNLNCNHIYDMISVDANTVWLATNGGGVNVFDWKKEKFSYLVHNDKNPKRSLVDNHCLSLLKDSKGNIWTGTYNGLSKYNPVTKEFISYLPDPKTQNSLSNNWIYRIYEDSQGNLWIGTTNGLNLYDPKNDKFRTFYASDGLSDNVINDIIEDNENHLWITSDKGLSRFNLADYTCESYGMEDGIQIYQFPIKSMYKNKEGLIFIGGKGGILSFDPKEIRDNPYVPEVRITGLRIFNKTINSKISPQILPKEIVCLNEISIPYKENVITLEFAAFNYINSSRNQYAYTLEGFDKDWLSVIEKKEITYTNLDPGQYIFKVKASNNDGIWNVKDAAIKITIMPPWWKTLFFRIAVILMIVGLFIGVYYLKLNNLRRNQIKLENLVNEKTRELAISNATKDKFFTLIAHDLRNPFNSLIGFSTLLNNDFNSIDEIKKKQIIELIHVSSKKIYDLLENLLQWAGTQTGSFTCKPVLFDIREVITTNYELLKETFHAKNNTFEMQIPDDSLIFADRNMINTVIRNLLGNAVKFTENGKVSISVLNHDHFHHITVTDTGIGIETDKIDEVFTVNNDLSSEGTRGEKGSGLGLVLCKEFIERNGGEIKVKSSSGKGTAFTFTIPKS